MSNTTREPSGPRGPRERSAFVAAFLSLVFPGLGHAYTGATTRALGFAALPILSLALLGGIIVRADRVEILGFLVQQPVLVALFVLNALTFVYRLVAAVDAWQVARYLNDGEATTAARGSASRLALKPLSAAGLIAVLLVMAGGHLAVAHYNALALDLVNCVFTSDSTDPSCNQPDASPAPTDSASPGSSDDTGGGPSPTDALPTPIGSDTGGTPAPTLPPWNGTDRLNILLVGTDQRPGDVTFNTDTLIVASIDPGTGRVAMFQVPRDTVDIPVPPNAQSLWGSVYRGKINSWFMQNRNMSNLWPGASANARGFTALKAILGQLYGLNINYYVMVNFQGFVKSVDTLGGVQINVQIPVVDDSFPITDSLKSRLYIPAGPQHMDGVLALAYARSRHYSAGGDFDRGRRQQRVILSLREQMNAQAILANLTGLVSALKSSVKTDIPTAQLPALLALAQRVDTTNVRSYVFAPPYYGTESTDAARGYHIEPDIARIRQAAAQAFTTDPKLIATRESLGAEAATVWLLNGTAPAGVAVNNADYLNYYGMNASAPNKSVASKLAHTKIVVYNGAEANLQQTIAYLENLYGVQATAATDPTVAANIVVTLGADAQMRTVVTAG